jgi:hypothetical protein
MKTDQSAKRLDVTICSEWRSRVGVHLNNSSETTRARSPAQKSELRKQNLVVTSWRFGAASARASIAPM